jgi:hypothetical protein
MGASGVDIQLSERARELIRFDTECKSRASFAVYPYFQQATENTGDGRTTLLVIKQDREEPLAILKLDDLLRIMSESIRV